MTIGLVKKKYTIRGTAPLMLHNGQLANPFNEITQEMKKISSKRKKTEDDLRDLANLEWRGGLYINSDGFPCIPSNLLKATLVNGAKKSRLGKQFTAGLFISDNPIIKHNGSGKTIDELSKDPQYRDQRMVKIQTSKILRTRPVFPEWELTFEVAFLPDVIEERDIDQAIETAGYIIGLAEYRPEYGRFEVIAS